MRPLIAAVACLLGSITLVSEQSVFLGVLPTNCSAGQLPVSAGSNAWSCGTGGSATAPGSTTQVMFNDGGVFGADAGLTYAKASDALTIGATVGILNLGATGVRLTDDGDGALTFLGQSAGADEDLTVNLDDTANTAVWTSSTGVIRWLLTGITNLGAQHFEGTGTAPTVDDTSGGNSCGASGNPSIDAQATDTALKFTVGAGGGTSCTVTFNSAFAQAPACVASDTGTTAITTVTSTASTVVIAGTLVAADVINVICMGQHP